MGDERPRFDGPVDALTAMALPCASGPGWLRYDEKREGVLATGRCSARSFSCSTTYHSARSMRSS
eukprot:4560909-Alexandrium_andersonii.AAC.1